MKTKVTLMIMKKKTYIVCCKPFTVLLIFFFFDFKRNHFTFQTEIKIFQIVKIIHITELFQK